MPVSSNLTQLILTGLSLAGCPSYTIDFAANTAGTPFPLTQEILVENGKQRECLRGGTVTVEPGAA